MAKAKVRRSESRSRARGSDLVVKLGFCAQGTGHLTNCNTNPNANANHKSEIRNQKSEIRNLILTLTVTLTLEIKEDLEITILEETATTMKTLVILGPLVVSSR